MDKQTSTPANFLQLPLLWLSLAFMLGLVAASQLAAARVNVVFLIAAAIALILGLLWRKLSSAARLALLAAIVFCFGGMRYWAAQPVFTPATLAYYNDSASRVTVSGFINRPPIYRDSYVELWVRASHIDLDGQPIAITGDLLARVDLGQTWVYGQGVELYGNLRTPSQNEEFSYRDYLARQGVYSEMSFASATLAVEENGGTWLGRALYTLRARGTAILHQLYPDSAAGLLVGILLGDESGISLSLKEAFNDTATRHIVAISGFNISIIAGLVLKLASDRVGVRKGIWIAAGCVVIYTLLVGAQASVVRAAIMALVVLGSHFTGRDQHSLNTLAFTGALMALINPLVVWDVGFQLSFAATLGLLVLAEPMQTWANAQLTRRLPAHWVDALQRPLSEYVLLTLAAQIFTLPLLLYHFGRLSLVAMPANLLVLPLQPAILILGGLSLLAGGVLPLFGQLFALLARPLAALTIYIVELCARPSWAAYNTGPFNLYLVFAYYAGLAVALIAPLRAKLVSLRVRPAIPAIVLAAAAFGTWSLASSTPSGHLQITLLDVKGEAILLQTPTGRSVLINGGASAVDLSAELGRHLPPFARQLDWLLVLGQRPEQINGLLSGVEKLNLSRVAWANSWPSPEFERLLVSFDALGYEPMALGPGQEMDLGAGATLQVLSVGSRGASVLVSWQDFQAFFPLGMEASQIAWLEQNPLPGLEILLLADGGYRPLNPPNWLEALDAELYWLTADGELADELRHVFTARVLMPASSLGWLQVETDGHTMWVRSEHNWP